MNSNTPTPEPMPELKPGMPERIYIKEQNGYGSYYGYLSDDSFITTGESTQYIRADLSRPAVGDAVTPCVCLTEDQLNRLPDYAKMVILNQANEIAALKSAPQPPAEDLRKVREALEFANKYRDAHLFKKRISQGDKTRRNYVSEEMRLDGISKIIEALSIINKMRV